MASDEAFEKTREDVKRVEDILKENERIKKEGEGMEIEELCEKAHATACEKGWHDKEVTIPEYISNLHGEVSEAFEEYRNGNKADEIIFVGNEGERLKPTGIPIELADVVIRIADMCFSEGIDLEGAIKTKMIYNNKRSHRHGGKIV